MWSAIISGVSGLVSQWFETKKAKQQAEAEYHKQALRGEQNWDLAAMKQARYSWKDELITIIWFSPLIVGWFDEDKAKEYVQFISGLPYFWQFAAFGIISASFGLRWYFKQQGFKIQKNVVQNNQGKVNG